MAFWSLFSPDFIGLGSDLRSRRSLERALSQAQIALGERMYRGGIDDGGLAAMIANIERKLREAKFLRQRLEAARTELIIQLAAAALEEDAPLPGAEAEYRKVREAQAELEAFLQPTSPGRSVISAGEVVLNSQAT